MHTPEGFTPSHALPAALPADTLAFAFRDDKILVGGADDAPVVPRSSELDGSWASAATGITSASSTASRASRFRFPADAPEPAGWRYAGLRSLFFRLPGAAAGDRRARVPGRRMGPHASLLRPLRNADARQGRASAPRNARRAATSPIRASRRR